MVSKSSPRPRLRRMRQSDLPSVMALETASFRKPWKKQDFIRCLKNKQKTLSWILEIGSDTNDVDNDDAGPSLVGYLVVELVDRTAHILNVAVVDAHRRRGYASRMLGEAEAYCTRKIKSADERAGAAGAGEEGLLLELSLEVEETNLAAQLLYKKLGYRATEVLRGHYGDEDGYKMVRKLYATPLGTAP